MELDLEYRIGDFRERAMGRNLSERYPIEFSEDGSIIQQEPSNSDFLKLISKLFVKFMVPYTGDKLMKEWVELESEIKPENSNKLYLSRAGITIAKYAALGILLDIWLDKVF